MRLCSVSSQLRAWQQVTLLDPKRANNLGIILSAVKLPFDAMRRAVLAMDTAALPLDSVNALLKCVPSAEELELVANAGVPTAALGGRKGPKGLPVREWVRVGCRWVGGSYEIRNDVRLRCCIDHWCFVG